MLAKTIGLRTGAAKRKPKAVPIGAPLARSPLATGTLPHSQAGKAEPHQGPGYWSQQWIFGKPVHPGGLGSQPARHPRDRRKGIASSKRPWKIAQALESFSKLVSTRCVRLFRSFATWDVIDLDRVV